MTFRKRTGKATKLGSPVHERPDERERTPLCPSWKSLMELCLSHDIVFETSSEPNMYHSPIQLDVFPTVVQMRRIDPVRNMRRFYRLSVHRDLFGCAALVREWGRIGSRGQMMSETHPDEGKAITALMKLAAMKKRRGYVD